MSGYSDFLYQPVAAAEDSIGLGRGPGMPAFLGALATFYHYVAGHAGGGAGIGTGGAALAQPQTLPINTRYSRGPLGSMVRGDLGPTRVAFAKQGQDFLPVDLIGQGTYYHGTTTMGALSPAGNIAPKAPGNG